MNLQLPLSENGQDWKQSTVYQGGSPASRTALQESVRRLLTSVICGSKCGEPLAKLSRDGSWVRMYEGYCQARMDGSFEEYCGILPKWGMMSGGVLYPLPQLEPCIDESGWRLLPTITTSDCKGGCLRKNSKKQMSNLKEFVYIFSDEQTRSIYLNTQFCESLMGFSKGWTELKPLETR